LTALGALLLVNGASAALWATGWVLFGPWTLAGSVALGLYGGWILESVPVFEATGRPPRLFARTWGRISEFLEALRTSHRRCLQESVFNRVVGSGVQVQVTQTQEGCRLATGVDRIELRRGRRADLWEVEWFRSTVHETAPLGVAVVRDIGGFLTRVGLSAGDLDRALRTLDRA
jgi:hypothetical protein